MILARMCRPALVAVLTLYAMQARADVLEINEGGAQWVSGPLAAVPAAGALTMAEAVPEGLLLPGEAVADPSLHARAVPAEYATTVAQLAARYDLSPSLIEALVWQESRWNANAVSPKGARGLAQLMPGTARQLGVDSDNPYTNLEGGARYLREQLDRFGGDLEKALAAYNAGPGRVERAKGVPQIRETQEYVAAIMGRLSNHSREEN